MAGDLIPPPSPAGKPAPEGPRREEDKNEHKGLWSATAPEEPVPAEVRAPQAPAEQTDPLAEAGPVPPRLRARFGFLTGALVGIGVAALAISALLLGAGGDGTREAAWSDWKPSSDDPYIAAEEIALHVANEYRLGDGTQLVAVNSGPLQVRDIPLQAVVKTAPVGGNFVPVYGKGVQYTLNGLGEGGSIAAGTPSTERLALLKRQALELALYTFRYIPEIDHVVALLPPRAPATPSPKPSASATPAATPGAVASLFGTKEEDRLRALLFRPGDLEQQLETPLELTLGPGTPRPENFPPESARFISEFTLRNVFVASVKESQNNAFLILERPTNLALDLYAPPDATPTPQPLASATPGKKKRR